MHLHCIAGLRAQSVQKHTLLPHWDEGLYAMGVPCNTVTFPFLTQSRGLRVQSVQKHTLTPHWDEDLYVMVQEPKTQNLRIQMFDRDLLNVKVRPAPYDLSYRV